MEHLTLKKAQRNARDKVVHEMLDTISPVVIALQFGISVSAVYNIDRRLAKTLGVPRRLGKKDGQ